MTVKDGIYEVMLGLQNLTPTPEINPATVKQYLYEALQNVRVEAEQMDYLFYTKSQSFSGSSVNYPAHFKTMVLNGIVVPLSSTGMSTMVSNRQYVTINANQYEKGSATKPVSRLFADHFENTPSVAGTFYYLWSFAFSTDETIEITDLVPWAFEELVILKTQQFIIQRFMMQATTPEFDKALDSVRQGAAALYKKWTPAMAYQEEQPSPVAPQQQQ